MVEYVDPETGELIKTLVDKVRKKKITPLKRAILKKRNENKMQLIQSREERKQALAKTHHDKDESFETVSEEDSHDDDEGD